MTELMKQREDEKQIKSDGDTVSVTVPAFLLTHYNQLQQENAKLRDQLTWRPVSELPEEDQIVIATYLNYYGKRRRVRAVYIRQYEEEAGDDDELCVEYCEERDEWYLKEGWYELVDNWPDYSLVTIVEGIVS